MLQFTMVIAYITIKITSTAPPSAVVWDYLQKAAPSFHSVVPLVSRQPKAGSGVTSGLHGNMEGLRSHGLPPNHPVVMDDHFSTPRNFRNSDTQLPPTKICLTNPTKRVKIVSNSSFGGVTTNNRYGGFSMFQQPAGWDDGGSPKKRPVFPWWLMKFQMCFTDQNCLVVSKMLGGTKNYNFTRVYGT